MACLDGLPPISGVIERSTEVMMSALYDPTSDCSTCTKPLSNITLQSLSDSLESIGQLQTRVYGASDRQARQLSGKRIGCSNICRYLVVVYTIVHN